jgi:hypothetical protein
VTGRKTTFKRVIIISSITIVAFTAVTFYIYLKLFSNRVWTPENKEDAELAQLIPKYPQATRWSIIHHGNSWTPAYSSICFKTKDSEDVVLRYYQKELEKLKWYASNIKHHSTYIPGELDSPKMISFDMIDKGSGMIRGNQDDIFLRKYTPWGCDFIILFH